MKRLNFLWMLHEARPKLFCLRPMPYALDQKVDAELDHLEQARVIEPMQFSY